MQFYQGSVGCPTLASKLASFHHFCYNTFVSARREDNYDR